MNNNLKNYSVEPDKEVWTRIAHTQHRKAVRRQATTATVGLALVAAAIVGVVCWPENKVTESVTTQQVVTEVAQVATQSMPQEVVSSAVVDNQVAHTDDVAQMSKEEAPRPVEAVAPVPLAQVAMPMPVLSEPTMRQPEPCAERISAPSATNRQPKAVENAETPTVAESEQVPSPAQSAIKASVSNPSSDTIFWIPNMFAPSSGDPAISTFRPKLNKASESVSGYRLIIFNRQGHRVFYSTDINAEWDGTYKGQILPQATYVYVLYYTDKDRLQHQRKGTVTLVR